MPRRKGGLFLPLDVNFMRDPRIVRARRQNKDAPWLYLAMCLASKALGSDGRLEPVEVELLQVSRWQQRLQTLIGVGLVDDVDGTYRLRQVCPPAGRRYISPVLRADVHARDGWACLHCGATDRLELDHVIPWSHGGPDTLDNLRTLCKSCNCRRGARV